MKEKQKMLGQRIRTIRELKGMSQEDLANKCGHTNENARSWISKIESGQRCPNIDDVFIIAESLGVEPFILFIETNPTPQMLDRMLKYLTLFERGNDHGSF